MLLTAIVVLIGLLLILLIYNNYYYIIEGYSAYTDSCSELSSKRAFLQTYINNLKDKVTNINNSLIGTASVKKENMNFQKFFTQFCMTTRPMSEACKKLASTDKYPLQELPNMDVYLVSLFNSEVDIDNLLQKLNYYSDLIGCSSNTVDASGYTFDVSTGLGEIDTESAFLELQKLSAYYLSPDTIKYILKFLISREKLNELNFTSKDYVNQFPPLVISVKSEYPQV
uniref:Uncharacterized protein n=1 Tax=viral metagenome TaxID=1070528 RepID=A0A6C0D818_9ZZZZ